MADEREKICIGIEIGGKGEGSVRRKEEEKEEE